MQSAPVQQVPTSQEPAQHFSPWAQSESPAHSLHSLAWQVLPAGQSGVTQQSPLLQAPLQHLLPAPPHSSSVRQGLHMPRMQASFAGQSAPLQHVAPGLQRLPQHLPPGQLLSLVHERHE